MRCVQMHAVDGNLSTLYSKSLPLPHLAWPPTSKWIIYRQQLTFISTNCEVSGGWSSCSFTRIPESSYLFRIQSADYSSFAHRMLTYSIEGNSPRSVRIYWTPSIICVVQCPLLIFLKKYDHSAWQESLRQKRQNPTLIFINCCNIPGTIRRRICQTVDIHRTYISYSYTIQLYVIRLYN